MKITLCVLIFSAFPLLARGPIFEAVIHGNGGTCIARALCVLEEATNELEMVITHRIKNAQVQIDGAGEIPNLGQAFKNGHHRLESRVALTSSSYRRLVAGDLTLNICAGKQEYSASLKRVYTINAYEVTITNVTRGQVFAPPIVVSHMRSYTPFTPGGVASNALATLAEEGDGSAMLAAVLSEDAGYHGTIGHGPILPGESMTLTVFGGGRFSDLSVMGMLVSTNDGFFAASNMTALAQPNFKAGGIRYTTRTHAFAYDAGSEANDEDCDHIPGCGGAGERATEGAEGFISVHNGIYGHGSLEPASYDWRGPVAMVSVTRVQTPKMLVINNVTVVDGTGSDPVSGMNIVLEGNRITQITSDTIDPGSRAEVVDGTGKYVVPGFFDMHTHYWETGAPDTSPTISDFRHVLPWEDHTDWINSRAAYTLSRFLCGGITTMVEQSSPNYSFELRKETEQLPYAPRLRLAGRFLGNTDFGFNYWTEDDPAVIGTYDPEAARAWLLEAISLGADHTKVGFIPLPDRDIEEWLPVFDVILEETHARGMKLAIHVTDLESAKVFVRRGADILAHPLWDDPPDQEFFDLVASNGVFLTSTLYIWDSYVNIWSLEPQLTDFELACGDRQIIESFNWLNTIPPELLPEEPALLSSATTFTANAIATVSGAYQAGVPIVVGSDAGNVGLLGGPSLHREFDMLAEAGMPPAAILQAATYNAARALGLDDELGSVRVGNLADLLILSANPLEDHRNLAAIDYIIKDGQLLPHSTLQSLTDDTPALDPLTTLKRVISHGHHNRH